MKLLNHTRITKVAKTTLLACSFLMPIAANAASLESTRISYTADRNSLIESDITQQLREASDTCFKIDKITGQVIPCETKTGGSSGSGDWIIGFHPGGAPGEAGTGSGARGVNIRKRRRLSHKK